MNKYVCNEKIFTTENALSFYLLGVFLTDGWIEKSKPNLVGFCSTDFEWIRDIKNIISLDLPLHTKKTKYKNLYHFEMNNKIIRKWFDKYGFTTNKSLDIQFPKIPNEYIISFIRGCWDGDGFISHTSRHKTGGRHNKDILYHDISCGISSGSKNFIDEMGANITRIFDIDVNITNKFSEKPDALYIVGRKCIDIHEHFMLRINGTKCYKFVKMLYDGAEIFLERKKIIADDVINYYNTNNIIPHDKIMWPKIDLLVAMVNNKGYRAVGRELNTTDCTVKNHIRSNNKLHLVKSPFVSFGSKNTQDNISQQK
jgi:hypothetical protein